MRISTIFVLFAVAAANSDGANLRHKREAFDFNQFLSNVGDAFSNAWSQLQDADWSQLQNLGDKIAQSEFVTSIVNSFQQIDWDEVRDGLFTAGDKISAHAVDAYEKAREVIRTQINCDNLDQSDSTLVADCVREKAANTNFYNQMKETIDSIKAEITKIEQDPNATEDRKRVAAQMQARIDQLESQSLNSASTNQIGLALFFALIGYLF